MLRANRALLATPLCTPTLTPTHTHTQACEANCAGMRNMCWLLSAAAAAVFAVTVSALQTH